VPEHAVGTREERLAARKRPLEREKELTRRSDELARKRQALPWVPVEKELRDSALKVAEAYLPSSQRSRRRPS
jgi:predicted dithiol-disulfide oxidoreductase (DUF899 family)